MGKLFLGLIAVILFAGCSLMANQQPVISDQQPVIEQEKPCRVKYHKLYETSRFMVVEGRLGEANKSYAVILDTGASQPIIVKGANIFDKRQVQPLQADTVNLNGYNLGSCNLAKLQIGDTTFENWPCVYLEKRMKLAVFGLSGHADDSIIMGVPALSKFNYIAFDSIAKEVEFSRDKAFEPSLPPLWMHYKLHIETDFHGNMFLFVELPLAGQMTELQLDTGSGNGLAIREELWEKMQRGPTMANISLKNSKELYPYIGQLQCRKGIVKSFEVGSRTVKNAMISVFPNNSPLLTECEGMIGMQYFRDTIMVLDFENKLMWVRST